MKIGATLQSPLERISNTKVLPCRGTKNAVSSFWPSQHHPQLLVLQKWLENNPLCVPVHLEGHTAHCSNRVLCVWSDMQCRYDEEKRPKKETRKMATASTQCQLKLCTPCTLRAPKPRLKPRLNQAISGHCSGPGSRFNQQHGLTVMGFLNHLNNRLYL